MTGMSSGTSLGRLFEQRRVERDQPLVGCRRGIEMRHKPVIHRHTNVEEDKRLKWQCKHGRQPQEPFVRWQPQLMDQCPKARSRNGNGQNGCQVNAGHINASKGLTTRDSCRAWRRWSFERHEGGSDPACGRLRAPALIHTVLFFRWPDSRFREAKHLVCCSGFQHMIYPVGSGLPGNLCGTCV